MGKPIGNKDPCQRKTPIFESHENTYDDNSTSDYQIEAMYIVTPTLFQAFSETAIGLFDHQLIEATNHVPKSPIKFGFPSQGVISLPYKPKMCLREI